MKGLLHIALEEVLPRPQAGLLNRLLRLAKVEWLDLKDRGPIFVLQPGKEYMVRPCSTHLLYSKVHKKGIFYRAFPLDCSCIL